MIKFLIGGSPCTHWSIAQSKAREKEPEGIGWELFKNYLIAKERFRPDYFLYENNKSASQQIKDQIAVELGVPLQYMNSALVSAQNRWRFYAHNIDDVPQPEDRGIMLIDVLESVTGEVTIPLDVTAKGGRAHRPLPAYAGRVVGRRINAEGHRDDYNTGLPHIQRFEVNVDPQKTNTISTVGKDNMVAIRVMETGNQYPVYEVSDGFITYNGVSYQIALPDGYYIIRQLTVKECCRLQTMPDDYCRAVSDSRAYRGLGSGWTAEVIMHIISHALTGIPKDEEIIVLSMYDGIGTGRYCFDKLGYKNIRYFATEIDKYAMHISESNYQDIIQLGDAFQVREAGWRLPL